MTPEEKRRFDIFSAFTEGATIQSKGTWDNATWMDNPKPLWRWDKFDYRIKDGWKTVRKFIPVGMTLGTPPFLMNSGAYSSMEAAITFGFNNPDFFGTKRSVLIVTVDFFSRNILGVTVHNVGENHAV